ncbi:unnamed protein product [Chondrus crispus]|uniref:Uncharacterized protein n=1 Tax=Chondrus crispus TaxID=2769 RepID=R7QTR8_CHOCR|nr:unnamed protein product [Chondrus crispus]CDF41098.1 unnamed protein product [Chondrus crispus]|eukprot:XP_005711392.1 unnamed protein product [Chondrus crispus]
MLTQCSRHARLQRCKCLDRSFSVLKFLCFLSASVAVAVFLSLLHHRNFLN